MKKINGWAIVVSVVATQILAAVWYTIFATVWAAGWGLTEVPANFMFARIASPLGDAIFAVGYAYLAVHLNLKGVGQYVAVALLIAGAFIVPGIITNGLFLGVSTATQFVDTFFLTLRVVVMALIIGAWQKKKMVT